MTKKEIEKIEEDRGVSTLVDKYNWILFKKFNSSSSDKYYLSGRDKTNKIHIDYLEELIRTYVVSIDEKVPIVIKEYKVVGCDKDMKKILDGDNIVINNSVLYLRNCKSYPKELICVWYKIKSDDDCCSVL